MARLAFLSRLSHPRRIGAALGGVALAVILTGVALAATAPAIQTFTPKSASQITNIDVLRQQIRNYYGDPLGTGDFALDSNYAKEAASVAAAGERWLAAYAHVPDAKTKAIVIDVDDTTLATYNYEIASNWAYSPASNADYVNNERFPAVPGMVDMVNRAAAEGYAVFVLTGRPVSQETVTIGNLAKVGYPTFATSMVYTKPAPADYPPYLLAACANDPHGSCTTDHYKAATRQYIESQNYDIVANFGDQYSDFSGGYENRTFKLPNPSYFLP